MAGEERVALPNQPTRWSLLVHLAVERRVAREDLLVRLWPDREPARARRALNQSIYALRQDLGPDWVDSGPNVLVVSSGVECDVHRFVQAADRGDAEEAVRAYGGPFLHAASLAGGNDFEMWVEGWRTQLERRYRELVSRQVRDAAEAGALERAVGLATAWTRAIPFDDRGHHRLIELLARSGHADAARAHFEAYAAILRNDLDSEPPRETVELVEGLEREPRGAEALSPLPAPALRAETDAPGAAPPAAAPAPPPGLEAVQGEAAATPPHRSVSPGSRALAAAVFTVSLAAGAGLWASLDDESSGSPLHRVAVTYFDERVPTAGGEGRGDMFTERLIEELAGVPGIWVAPAARVRPFRDAPDATGLVVEELGVGTVVTGSVELLDGLWRLSFEVLDGPSGERLAGRTLGPWRRASDVMGDGVAEAARALRGALGREIRLRTLRAGTSVDGAWDAYVRAHRAESGLVALIRAHEVDEVRASLERADSLLRLAARRDPAWSAPPVLAARLSLKRAATERVFGVRYGEDPSARANPILRQGLAWTTGALELAPRSASALEARALLEYELALHTSGPEAEDLRARAARDAREATEVDSLRSGAWLVRGRLAWDDGDAATARRSLLRAWEADTWLDDDGEIPLLLYQTSFDLEEDEEAARWCETGARRHPDAPPFLWCRLELAAWGDGPADPDSAYRLVERHADPGTRVQPTLAGRYLMLIAAVAARAGDHGEAEELVRSAREESGSDPALDWLEAGVRLRMDQPERAAELLARWARRDDGGKALALLDSRALRDLAGHPLLAGIRGIPERRAEVN